MAELHARHAELGERYRASLAVKRAGIEQAWHALAADPDNRTRRETLLRLVHRIAGSAPSYGYTEIGRLASEAEAGLESLQGNESRSGASPLSDPGALIDRLLDALDAARLE